MYLGCRPRLKGCFPDGCHIPETLKPPQAPLQLEVPNIKGIIEAQAYSADGTDNLGQEATSGQGFPQEGVHTSGMSLHALLKVTVPHAAGPPTSRDS